jgi:hypothetical protein
MEPTTGASPYHQMQEQHIRRLHQSLSQEHPVTLEHQAEAALEAHLSLHQRQALAAIQDLEHQRQQMWSQDLGANPHR